MSTTPQIIRKDRLLIGIDVGTSSVKAGLFNAQGEELARYANVYSTDRKADGFATQDAQDWMRLVVDALEMISSDVAGADIAGVGLTSQVNTHVFVDYDLKPLLPAFTWQDTRCANVAAELDALVSQTDKIKWWAAPLPIDASHVLARMAFVQKHLPDVWAKTAYVFAPKDFCIAHLTGKIITDPMTAFGVVDSHLQLIEPLVALVEGARERLPAIAGFTTAAGKICDGLPFAGVPIAVGAMDAWAGFLGAGARQNGDAIYISGTSEILGIVSRDKMPTPGVIAFPECEGLTIHAGPTQSGGASLAWAARLLNRPIEELVQMVSALSPDTQCPVFLPHLDGTRAPLWDAEARGAFAEVSAAMGPAAFGLAVMEGVAYSVKLLLSSLQHSANMQPEHMVLTGGGARADIWCQIRADVLGMPMHRLKNTDAGIAGAAMLAGVGVGVYQSLEIAAGQFVQVDRIFLPRLELTKRHKLGFERYVATYNAMRGIKF